VSHARSQTQAPLLLLLLLVVQQHHLPAHPLLPLVWVCVLLLLLLHWPSAAACA
jgi:hypothetical protein